MELDKAKDKAAKPKAHMESAQKIGSAAGRLRGTAAADRAVPDADALRAEPQQKQVR